MFSFDYLSELRAAELTRVTPHLSAGQKLLEIGAGTGQQAKMLSDLGLDVSAIEVGSSLYSDARVFPLIDYDGTSLPFSDDFFDVVYSSNVLEHVKDLSAMHREIARVLKPDGFAVHLMPTTAWRFWTSLASFPAGLTAAMKAKSPLRAAKSLASMFLQRRHGERGFVLTELWYFRPQWWRDNFAANGFSIERDEPVGIFYSGHMIFGPSLSLKMREDLAWLGSACHLFKVKPQ